MTTEMIRVGKLSYDRREVVGRGKFGIVFRGVATDSTSGIEMLVAVKRILKLDVADASFLQEVEVMQRASFHSCILRYICTEQDADYLFLATELCHGTLDNYINGTYCGSKLLNNEKKILLQVTQGLAYLRSKKIVHRDIKPTNILFFLCEISAEPQMKLADFGLSKLLKTDQEDFTNSNHINPSGTRGWMAPEAYQKRFGFEVDNWALGLIFGYTLNGEKHPYGEEPDRQSRIKKKKPMIQVQEDLKTPYSKNAEVFDLIKSMLEIKPENRPKIKEIKSNL